VDLENQTVTGPSDFHATFGVDAFRRHCLLNGLDDIGLTLQHEPDITAFEQRTGKF
jgi:3-isopropylmalate/(R)-2-methylmalate dehydratase small subunit